MPDLCEQVSSGATFMLADRACQLGFADLDEDAKTIARQCVLDYFAVTLAGANEHVVRILLEEFDVPQVLSGSAVFGHSQNLPAIYAALVNGAASHALDFDDVNMAMPGHPTAAVMPALFALAEQTKATGKQLVEAFVAGYELECALGDTMRPGHYEAGYHSTATLGSLGAAAACGRLLRIGNEQMSHALAIAATQAAGLKSHFGTMCKPFHAGKASQNGYIAAKLAQRGFTGRTDIIECQQGFAETHGPDFDPARLAAPYKISHWLRQNLFKFHASCYLTHAPIEAALIISEDEAFDVHSVSSISINVNQMCGNVCNIENPRTGLEAKFSLRAMTAMPLAGINTAERSSFDDTTLENRQLQKLIDCAQVQLSDNRGANAARVEVTLADGRVLAAEHNSGIPESNLDRQTEKLRNKFAALAGPVIGDAQANKLSSLLLQVEELESIEELSALVSVA